MNYSHRASDTTSLPQRGYWASGIHNVCDDRPQVFIWWWPQWAAMVKNLYTHVSWETHWCVVNSDQRYYVVILSKHKIHTCGENKIHSPNMSMIPIEKVFSEAGTLALRHANKGFWRWNWRYALTRASYWSAHAYASLAVWSWWSWSSIQILDSPMRER